MKRHCLAVGAAALSLMFAAPVMAQDHRDAQGMPTDHSTPAERAATAALNQQIYDTNAAADAKAAAQKSHYQHEEQQYQQQLEQNRKAQAHYQEQRATYENLRAHYAAERAAYHRAAWPDRWSRLTLDQADANLIGQRVEILSGEHVGSVRNVAHSPAGHVEAIQVALDSGKQVWIDRGDIRYDRAGGIVMTDLDRADLHAMADEGP